MIYKIITVFVYFNCVFGDNFEATDEPLVNTTSGTVRGLTINVLNQKIDQFLGIPYAEPPLGSMRFAKPKPISKPIEGVIDCTKSKYSCIQITDPITTSGLNVNEDCLTLNIWTQKREDNNSTKLKPVMFWIYGGGFSVGSIFQSAYNGRVLSTHDIVFVSVNYRVGPLGFLFGGVESGPGNVGLFDQELGLKWVRENIHLFGGDKNQITIFGESAGSWSVSAHLISPQSKGLFKRAIMESGAVIENKERPYVTKEEAVNNAKQLAKRVNCTDDKQWLECLRKVDPLLLATDSFNLTYPIFGTEFLPLTAQKSFTDFKFNKDLDIMAGVTKDEGTFLTLFLWPQFINKQNVTKEDFIKIVKKADNIFHELNVENITEFYLNNINTSDSNAIKWKAFDFFGDLEMKCPTYLFAKKYAEHSSPETNVFFYEWNHIMLKLNGTDLGIYHGADIPFVFGLALVNPNSTSEENIKFSEEVVNLWTNFAKYGKPDSNWPQLIDTKTHSSVTQIKDMDPKNPNKYFNNLFTKNCDEFWSYYF